MASTMSPSNMTDGQIDKAADVLRAVLRKHRFDLDSESMQEILSNSTLSSKLWTVFRGMAVIVNKMVVRHVKVNRGRTPNMALDDLGRKQYVDYRVALTMYFGQGNDNDVYFFYIPWFESLHDKILEEEYKSRCLVPADPYEIIAVNEGDPVFSDKYPNATHWKDAENRWCHLSFYRVEDELRVRATYDEYWSCFDGGWWFAGVRK